ncbi:hypothetical protein ACFVRT_01560 [Arthrobacter koreensis]|uniref:Integral membrane protein n=1 Tax=Arthrobacter koreensis TaxID=199136 RepID=A0ABY6FQ33_9MICC|nr:hypothetical protein [Arthrobacter koreensis]UYB35316.1 hypothetical protein N9A08_11820 [Arthrobacter koreensis]
MRTFGSAILVLLALVLSGAAVGSAWLAQNVVSAQGFAQLAQPLGEDEPFQAQLSTAVASQASAAVTDGLPDGLVSLVEPIIERVVSGFQDAQGYPEAWTQTLERSHTATFDSGTPTLDLGPLLTLVNAQIAGEIGTEPADAGERLLTVSGQDRSAELETLVRFADSWPLLAAAAVLAALLALLVARRRSTTLALTGAGLAVLAGVLWLASGAAGRVVEGQTPANPVASTFVDGLVPLAQASFQSWLLVLLIGGGVAFVLGLVLRLAAGSRRDVR